MSLSSINIEDLVTSQTRRFIEKNDFAQLKEWAVHIEPVSHVMTVVNDMLKQNLDEDKSLVQADLTDKAFENQLTADQAEASRDEASASADEREAQTLREEIRGNDRFISDLRSNLNTLRPQLDSLRGQIASLETRIFAEQMSHSHHHHHGHRHHADLASSIIHAAVDTGLLASLYSQKNDLLREMSRLNAQYLSAKSDLDRLEKRNRDISRTLNNTLPQNQRDRDWRERERGERARARARASDPDLNQLSSNNRSGLRSQIQMHHARLQAEHDSLQRWARDNSYPVYSRQLQSMYGNLNNLDYHEREAMRRVLESMGNCLAARDAERQARVALATANGQLAMRQQSLQADERRELALRQSNPALQRTNKQLAENNIRLNAEILSRQSTRKKVLVASVVAISMALLFVGAGLALLFTAPVAATFAPLLFLPAMVAGLALIGLGIAAWVLTVKNNRARAAIQANSSQISSNNDQLANQTEEINSLGNKIVQTGVQIGHTLSNIRAIDAEIAQHMQAAEFHQNTARGINAEVPVSLYPHAANVSFFHSPQDTKPSAPPLNKECDSSQIVSPEHELPETNASLKQSF